MGQRRREVLGVPWPRHDIDLVGALGLPTGMTTRQLRTFWYRWRGQRTHDGVGGEVGMHVVDTELMRCYRWRGRRGRRVCRVPMAYRCHVRGVGNYGGLAVAWDNACVVVSVSHDIDAAWDGSVH